MDHRKHSSAATLSVIIPALNEAHHIGAALDSAGRADGVETIVVDGGSRDETVAVAASRGATVITCRPGRGRQMNAGAAAAAGRILLFLHADTHLPPGYAGHVRRALAVRGVAAGAFSLKTDVQRPSLRFIEMVANFRSRVLKMPYGDQGLFVEKRLFRQVGGFADMPIMEDFDLVRRLHRIGDIVTLTQPALTSARRWLNLGVLKTWLINQAGVCAYLCRLDPRRIAGWYDAQRPR